MVEEVYALITAQPTFNHVIWIVMKRRSWGCLHHGPRVGHMQQLQFYNNTSVRGGGAIYLAFYPAKNLLW